MKAARIGVKSHLFNRSKSRAVLRRISTRKVRKSGIGTGFAKLFESILPVDHRDKLDDGGMFIGHLKLPTRSFVTLL